MKAILKYFTFTAFGLVLGLGLASTDKGQKLAVGVKATASSVSSSSLEKIIEYSESRGTRDLVLLENPSLIKSIMKGGSFGGEFSRAAAQHMFDRNHQDSVDDITEKSRAELIAPRTWMLYLPIVNAVLFETDEGLVLVDAGMAPAGPAIAKLIKSVSDKPLHTIIYTHGHVDHAYGTWALMEDQPQIIAHEKLPQRFDRYIRLRGSLAKFMSQPTTSLPKTTGDLIYPTVTFQDQLEIIVGGETFVLKHHRGETDDQLYVWAPERKALASADYYQGFLPNAGNGKRQQRYVADWAAAVDEMAALGAEHLLPAHGKAISDAALIKENLNTLGETLQHVVDHVTLELNKGTRKGLIPYKLQLPDHLANHPTMNEQYVSPADIAKMVIRQYTGWWDEVPSHWSPATLEARSREIAQLSGGITQLIARAHTLIDGDIVMASHLADWAWYADPENAQVQELVIEVYKKRVVDERSNTMEMLAYLDQIVAARDRQLTNKHNN